VAEKLVNANAAREYVTGEDEGSLDNFVLSAER
jgi:hypothetical protein